MELREYLRLWYLQCGTRPLDGATWLLGGASKKEADIYDICVRHGYLNRIKAGEYDNITPKGLEFIKNG